MKASLSGIFRETLTQTRGQLAGEKRKKTEAHKKQLEIEERLRQRALGALKECGKTLTKITKEVRKIAEILHSPNGDFDSESTNHKLLTLCQVEIAGVSYIACIQAPKPKVRRLRKRAISVYCKSRGDIVFFPLHPDDLHTIGVGMIDFLCSLTEPENLVKAIAKAVAKNRFER
jgi:hypothetical protein